MFQCTGLSSSTLADTYTWPCNIFIKNTQKRQHAIASLTLRLLSLALLGKDSPMLACTLSMKVCRKSGLYIIRLPSVDVLIPEN